MFENFWVFIKSIIQKFLQSLNSNLIRVFKIRNVGIIEALKQKNLYNWCESIKLITVILRKYNSDTLIYDMINVI